MNGNKKSETPNYMDLSLKEFMQLTPQTLLEKGAMNSKHYNDEKTRKMWKEKWNVNKKSETLNYMDLSLKEFMQLTPQTLLEKGAMNSKHYNDEKTRKMWKEKWNIINEKKKDEKNITLDVHFVNNDGGNLLISTISNPKEIIQTAKKIKQEKSTNTKLNFNF